MKAASRSVIRGISCGKLRFFEAAGGREGAGEAARLGIFCRGLDLVGDPRELWLGALRLSQIGGQRRANRPMFQNGGRGRGGGGFRGGRGSGRGAGRERSLHSGGRNLYHGEPAQAARAPASSAVAAAAAATAGAAAGAATAAAAAAAASAAAAATSAAGAAGTATPAGAAAAAGCRRCR